MAQQIITRTAAPVKGLYTSAVADSIGPEYTPWCQNVRFRFAKVTRAPGRSVVLQTRQKSLLDFALHTDIAGNQTVFSLEANALNDWQAAPYNDTNKTFGSPLNLGLTGSDINQRFSWTQGEERLLICRSSTIAGISASSPGVFVVEQVPSPAGLYLEYFKNHVFMLNVVGAANRVQWSARGNYADWTTTQMHGGFLDLYDGRVEAITGGKVLGDRLVIYRPTSITDFTATGDDENPFLPEGRVFGLGCAAPWSLTSMGQFHMFIANDFNVYQWDGVNLNAVGTPVHSYIRQLFDPDYWQWGYTPFGAAFMGYKEYWLVFKLPTPNTDAAVVLIYDYLRDTWTRDYFPISPQALFEQQLSGLGSSPGFNGAGYPNRWPCLMVGRGNDYYQIDERVDGDRYTRPADGGSEMWFDTPDLYWDKTSLQNGTLERVMVAQDYPVNPTDPPYYLEVSLDRGLSFPYAVQVSPIQGHLGFEFEDLNVTGNVHRLRFHCKAADGAGNPTWRAYSEISVPSGEFFPEILPAPPPPVIGPQLSAFGSEQGQTGVSVAANEPVSPDLRRRDPTDVRGVQGGDDEPDEPVLRVRAG